MISASAGANGSISPSGSVSVTQGASQAFTITANTGYQVQDVLVDGASVGAVTSYTFSNVTAAHTIAASFVAKTYAITASAGTNGSISPSGSVSVTQGASQAFTITANTGYQVQDVLVDGTSVGAVTSYTFSNVTAAHTIAASFVAKTYAITASAGTNGSISPSGSVSVTQGASQAFTITANTGYQVQGCSGGWHIGWSGNFLYLLQCYSRSHHRGQLCGQNLCHHSFRRDKWINQPLRQCFGDHTAPARLLPSRQIPAIRYRMSWWMAHRLEQ